MPGIIIPNLGYLDFTGDYKPGDPPPSGYMDWHEWANVQHKAGLKQVTCGQCGKFHFPQELSAERIEYTAMTKKRGGVEVHGSLPLCLKCLAARQEAQ